LSSEGVNHLDPMTIDKSRDGVRALLTLNLTSHQSYRSDACFPHTLLPPPVCLSRQTSPGAKYSRPPWPGNPPGFQPRRSEFPSPFAPARYFAARLRRSFVPAAAMFDVT